MVKWNSMSRAGKYHAPGIDEPCPTVATQSRLGVAQVSFLSKYYGGSPEGKSVSVEEPAGAITTRDHHSFITAYYGNGHNHSIDEPAQTVTANRKWHYLMNPQFQSAGGSVDSPCFTLIARMDKMPPYLIQTEQGEMAIVIEPDDSPAMVKIKQFMALYGIIDIKMRMLRIPELKRIMGFPSDYVLVGTQADQKKFIGNAVEVNMARVLCEALCARLIEEDIKPIRAAA